MGYLKSRVQKECKARTVKVFKEEIERLCADKQMESYCMRVIRSMPRRIQACIKPGVVLQLIDGDTYHFIPISLQLFHFSTALCARAPPEPRKGRFACPTVPYTFMLLNGT